MKGEHYLYAHYAADCEETIFYVGVGTRDRAWSKSGRCQEWHEFVRQHGLRVVLWSCNMTKGDALALESHIVPMLIGAGINLVNIHKRRSKK